MNLFRGSTVGRYKVTIGVSYEIEAETPEEAEEEAVSLFEEDLRIQPFDFQNWVEAMSEESLGHWGSVDVKAADSASV